jgi:hypothetical protein
MRDEIKLLRRKLSPWLKEDNSDQTIKTSKISLMFENSIDRSRMSLAIMNNLFILGLQLKSRGWYKWIKDIRGVSNILGDRTRMSDELVDHRESLDCQGKNSLIVNSIIMINSWLMIQDPSLWIIRRALRDFGSLIFGGDSVLWQYLEKRNLIIWNNPEIPIFWWGSSLALSLKVFVGYINDTQWIQ